MKIKEELKLAIYHLLLVVVLRLKKKIKIKDKI